MRIHYRLARSPFRLDVDDRGLAQRVGQRDQALRYLERAYEERSTVLAYLLIDPRLASLRDDPRFLALARRLGEE